MYKCIDTHIDMTCVHMYININMTWARLSIRNGDFHWALDVIKHCNFSLSTQEEMGNEHTHTMMWPATAVTWCFKLVVYWEKKNTNNFQLHSTLVGACHCTKKHPKGLGSIHSSSSVDLTTIDWDIPQKPPEQWSLNGNFLLVLQIGNQEIIHNHCLW